MSSDAKSEAPKALNDHDLCILDSAFDRFFHSFNEFPRSCGIEGVPMTPSELSRYQDGFDAGREAAKFAAALLMIRWERDRSM